MPPAGSTGCGPTGCLRRVPYRTSRRSVSAWDKVYVRDPVGWCMLNGSTKQKFSFKNKYLYSSFCIAERFLASRNGEFVPCTTNFYNAETCSAS
ncbi:hypothetical protein BC2230_50254 [Burkholderia cepacia]